MFISSSDFHPELTLHPVGYLASPLESLRGPTHLGPHGIPDHSSPQSLSPCHPILINKGLRSSPVAQVGAGGCLALSSSNHKSTINSTSCDLLNPSTSCPHHLLVFIYCFSSALDSRPKLRVRRAMDKFILYFRVTELEISGFSLFGKIE